MLAAPFRSSTGSKVPGWTHRGVAGDALLWGIGYSEGGGKNITVAGAGNQFVTLGGGFHRKGIAAWSQLLTGFTVGDSYRLDFKASGECPACGSQTIISQIDQLLDVSQTFTVSNSVGLYWKDWRPEAMTFVADLPRLTLTFLSTTQFDVGLDDVSITDVTVAGGIAAPGTLALLSLGLLLGSGLAIKQRRLQDLTPS